MRGNHSHRSALDQHEIRIGAAQSCQPADSPSSNARTSSSESTGVPAAKGVLNKDAYRRIHHVAHQRSPYKNRDPDRVRISPRPRKQLSAFAAGRLREITQTFHTATFPKGSTDPSFKTPSQSIFSNASLHIADLSTFRNSFNHNLTFLFFFGLKKNNGHLDNWS